ncbi:(deoxy)nucleoside triphosphate pyrophosphohydrolase [Myceligenerans salitolerans]|uniref:8-oxo-dGTP diphosphatase n=1 Tax=Myceligenerans salitolerans TaxID=1230528 RepID=A0ABS3I728_9MICO|nr:(deoxy)nucleoside triphosphate pyrophosphohydrolase [Myceligenerans salitolerans]MBO0608204.1 (deoxy)nucleoside triphosphate pyrophosphohydrolase [Myceligenerans salitolerans]
MAAPILVVAAALVDDLDRPARLLAARRTRPEALAGRWEFPGGKVDPGESPPEALHRELREELGVAVRLGREVVGPDDGCWPLTDRYRMRLWLGRITEGRPEPLEDHDVLRWLTRAELGDVDWIEGDLPIVAALRGYFPDSP